MQRVVIDKPGGYSRLRLTTEPDRAPEAGQLAIKVRAIGVNYADCIVRMGLYSSANKYIGFPVTPGFDFAGTVTSTGPGVQRFKPGDEVLGVTRFGAYQSQLTVDEHQVFGLPSGFTMQRAAAFPTVHLTAWYALCELNRPRAGQKVLVHTAAGGVGTAALRIAKHLGLETVGVVGTDEKMRCAHEAGATHVVARRAARGAPERKYWPEIRKLAPEGYDVVLEASGVSTLRKSYEHLRPSGRLMVFGMGTLLPSGGKGVNWLKLAAGFLKLPRFNPLKMLDDNKTVAAFNLSYLFSEKQLLGEAMTELLRWAEAGKLPEPPIREYALSDVRQAHADLESTTTVGKLVLIPDP